MPSQLTAAVIEDDALSMRVICQLLEKEPSITLLGEFSNGTDGLRFLASQAVNLLVLDVELPDMTGLELLQALPNPPLTVLISSEMKYAVESYRYNVQDYLLKPIKPADFIGAIRKVRDSYNRQLQQPEKPQDFIFVRKENQYHRIDVDSILFVEANRKNAVIHTAKENFEVMANISSFEEMLPANTFMRVHRSYLVRLSAIELMQSNVAVIRNKAIPISRSVVEKLEGRLNIVR